MSLSPQTASIYKRCMPKDFTWGPGGWPKTPRGGGVFATATPQVFIWAYIYERTWALFLVRDFSLRHGTSTEPTG
jgi:hypothetical protein